MGHCHSRTKNDMPRRNTPDPYAQQVGARIRELRLERNMSLADLANASELSKGHLSSVEHGLAAITIGTIQRLAQGFDLPPLYILAFAAEDEYSKVAELLREMPIADVKKVRKQLQGQVGKKR